MATKKKKQKIRPWVQRLILSRGACMSGAIRASRFENPIAAWNKTQDPSELGWAIYTYAEDHVSHKYAAFIRGWGMALKYNEDPRERRRLARAIRVIFSRPDAFA